MADPILTVPDLDHLLAAMARLMQPDIFKAVMEAGGLMLAGKFKKYPAANRLTRTAVYGAPFSSERQRRWFFAALRDGSLIVPYYRGQNPKSENFQQSWVVEVKSETQAVVGSQTSYGPLVMGTEKQTLYAKEVGWRTIDVIVNESGNDVQQAMQGALDKVVGANWR